ncbi:hypothetical protein PF005_g3525 [Phytophthora fragariae]|uniref:Uncharacterized protein n=2 Tax=Phytophthora TaxID=4783 RepID=A0A6A4EF92_9STRA|nr:hypothetical protein PF003_g14559 [Phytophthora fragariae]KAE8986034.1 hypothetical protein PR002_g22468 [Phytophthora rubi]KAE8946461.1 hypothetical protein PF009_g3889 [Phytophthora fragariae]KAE9018658.1 hypothetical protein PR001_g14075 [Phytophthora rubi]KAE9026978.1 hypothetical protein PF011_g2273 [Phytophthora fragariae]
MRSRPSARAEPAVVRWVLLRCASLAAGRASLPLARRGASRSLARSIVRGGNGAGFSVDRRVATARL